MRRLAPLLLAGCASAPQPPVEVRVPVPVPCPAPPDTVRPALPLADLTPDSPPDVVLRAYAASIEVLMGYAESVETLLDAYRPPGIGSVAP